MDKLLVEGHITLNFIVHKYTLIKIVKLHRSTDSYCCLSSYFVLIED